MFCREIRHLTNPVPSASETCGKKSPLGFTAAFGPFSNGKIHSEFQTIAFEYSLWKMTNVNFFCVYCQCVLCFSVFLFKDLKLFLISVYLFVN